MENNFFEVAQEKIKRVIYTPSPFAKNNLMYLQEIGELSASEVHTSKRDSLDSFLFFIVEKGSGTVIYDSDEYHISAGDCIFIDCKKPYSHESSKDLWRLKWIHFNGKMLQGIYDKYIERGGRVTFSLYDIDNEYSNGLYDRYSGIWQDVFAIAQSSDHIRDMKINEKLSSLMCYLMEESVYPSDNKEIKKSNLSDIRNYLDANYRNKISLDELANIFFVNKFYLTRIFKEEYDTTINNYLLGVRITKAKSMLRFTDLSIEKIGLDCGIGEACYFSRKFKEVEGMSPKEYRYKWR